MNFKNIFINWRKYSEMSNLGEIARRKFFNNCFDGALTCAGIVSGFFIMFLSDPTRNVPNTVIITGFATAIAIGISGLWGAFLSEEAERRKKITDMKKEMAIIETDDEETIDHSENNIKKIKNKKKKNKSNILERAENFATIVASLVDGGAPVLGSSLPLVPFFFGTVLTPIHFIISYIVLVGLLIYLGFFLGKISGGGRVRYAIHLVTAGVVTLIVSILLGQIAG